MNEITTITPGLGGAVAAAPSALANSDQQRAIAEVQAAMVIARANPRDERRAMDRISNACQRRGLAEVAVYSYARGGSDVTGPSIRLAEALAQNWGNLQFGIRELEQRNGESVVQAFAWDVETNVRREMAFTVPHVRHTRQGSKRLTDPRDIYEMVANQGARRLRSCILAVIPGDVVDTAVFECEKTMKANADTSPEAMQSMVIAFQAFGVVQQQLETRIQRRLDAIQPAQVVALKKIYASLRDGMSSPNDWFDTIEDAAEVKGGKGNAAAKAALAAAGKKSEPEQATAEVLGDEIPAFDKKDASQPTDGTLSDDNPHAEEGPDQSQRGEAQAEAAKPARRKPAAKGLIGQLRDEIANATDSIELDAARDSFAAAKASLSDDEVREIRDLIATRSNELA